ncbi:MAG: tRNA pseudouridine(38-40) synthase TruA [Deltaproteobacteria bacterium]|nr:tRNA pseudouridine(38-40) synthase TruA [Deltaproteobacteria bacterium]
MRNIKIIIEYEGTNYAGWQEQKESPTIQGTIQDKIKIITREDVQLTAAGRTDAAVHALGQTANFYSNTNIESFALQRGLNSLLPSDIVIKKVEDASLEFDARKDAKSKTYKYLILNRAYPSAVHRNFSWFVPYKLDIDLMKRGAEFLIGEKDFSSFRASACEASHAIREIISITIETFTNPLTLILSPEGRAGTHPKDGWGEGGFSEQREKDDFIAIEVKGTAFLMHMIRIIVGTLTLLGRGKISIDDFKNIIEAKDRTKAGMTAPPHGLFLKEVEY